ncbi:DUF2147 domain-containing protein [Ideonella sp. BN130291]|uniref:DUF2147 domain-containing protein n=1 Tax=Ideonella sp. BN130291 TaxID=3112940 RepID=UPI002E261B07|nr:DUF2147 domain-containing protein [Ideonella sp. BN130291]
MSTRSSLCAAALGLASLAAFAQAPSADPRGRWITASGNLEVEVAPCGAALCGVVTKVIANHSMSRPGEAMQPADTRPALGMTLLKNFTAEEGEAGTWRGEIYNRENGKTYSGLMSLDANGAMVLRAYVGLPAFGKTQLWQRAAFAADAPR